MLFIHPMWDHETQRLGKKKCTSVGYALHGAAEGIGYLGLLVLAISGVAFLCLWFARASRSFATHCLLLALALGFISEVMFQFSWWLALRRDFRHDDHEASWVEDGRRKTYKFSRASDRSNAP